MTNGFKLPRADENSALERDSIKKLAHALPSDRFVFRDERASDAGVDASIELVSDGFYTNMRAQVQLKATSSPSFNSDGSVSLSIRVSNLNYLRNTLCGVYVLCLSPQDEFRFAWAEDIAAAVGSERLESQDSVAVRFMRVLDNDALDEIQEKVLRTHRLHRSIADELARSPMSGVRRLSVERGRMELIPVAKITQFLSDSGFEVVSLGYAGSVLMLFEKGEVRMEEDTRLRLVRAYANYCLGRCHSSLGLLSEVAESEEELSASDRRFLLRLETACRATVGQLSHGDYVERLAERLTDDPVARLEVRLEEWRGRLSMVEPFSGSHASELEAIARDAAELEEVPDTIRAKLSILELLWRGHAAVHAMARVRLAAVMTSEIDRGLANAASVRRMAEDSRSAFFDWKRSAERLRQTIVASADRLLLLELDLAVAVVVNIMVLRSSAGPAEKSGSEVSSLLQSQIDNLQRALQTYRTMGSVVGEVRVILVLSDTLLLQDNEDARAERTLLVGGAIRKAQVHGLSALHEAVERRAESDYKLVPDPLPEDPKARDFAVSEQTDEEVKRMAESFVDASGGPTAWVPVVHEWMLSLRRAASVRIEHCRHVAVKEENPGLVPREHRFARRPRQQTVCNERGFVYTRPAFDSDQQIERLRKECCGSCPERAPWSR